MSALQTYLAVAEEFGITDELNQTIPGRLGFAREQSNQMKSIINRLLFDITMAKVKVEEAKDEDTKQAYSAKINEYAGQLRQTRDGLKTTNELVADLEKLLAED